MSTYGNKLQDFDSESIFAHSLVEGGEALKQMADLKYALDDNVKQVISYLLSGIISSSISLLTS